MSWYVRKEASPVAHMIKSAWNVGKLNSIMLEKITLKLAISFRYTAK